MHNAAKNLIMSNVSRSTCNTAIDTFNSFSHFTLITAAVIDLF